MTSIKSTTRPLLLTLALVFTFTFDSSPVMAGLFWKSELSGAWNERFEDVTKLKAYTDKGIKVDISDAIIGQYDLTDAVFDGASFRDNEWNGTTGDNMTFTNTIFRNNTFNSVKFKASTFTNVTFEDSEFNRAIFVDSQLHNVKFIRCTFDRNTAIVGLKMNSTIDFDHSKLTNTSLSESQATLSFHNSTLNDVELTDLVFPSALTFENSKLEAVETSRSNLTKLVMDNVTGGRGSGSNGGNIAEVEVRNTALGFGLNDGTFGKISFVNSTIESSFNNADIKELQVTNCKDMKKLVMFNSKVDTLQISNCAVYNFRPLEAIILNFSIDKASIVGSRFEGMKVENFILTDVQLGGLLDFSNAQVKNLTTKNVTKQPSLNLILTGSNVKF